LILTTIYSHLLRFAWVNFIDILRVAKKADNFAVFFALLGYMGVKAAHIMLMKLTPGLNFTNIICAAFTPVAPISVRIQSSLQYLITLLGSMGAKAAHRMLVKLISDPKKTLINA